MTLLKFLHIPLVSSLTLRAARSSKSIAISAILCWCMQTSMSLKAQFYYGMQQEFGKNRVQYQPFNWVYFGFDRYQVYTYEGGKDIAKYVAKRADAHLRELEKRLDFQTDSKIQIIVFNNQGDFRQTNLGLANEESGNLGGVTKIVDTKISVYFTGNHYELDKQIRAGIAELLINEMMYGGRARDMVKNSTLLVIPDWFKLGLISYLTEDWNVDLDDKIADGIENDRYYRFNKLTGEEAVVSGHALWNYTAETYGESVIPNILYMSKVTRNIESAFIFILGTSVTNLTYEWIDAFSRRNQLRDSSLVMPKKEEAILKKPKSFRNYYQLKLSPDGQQVIYATNELSQYKVFLKDLGNEKKAKRIVKWGPKVDRINDLTYPLLAWHPHGEVFAMVHEKKGIILFTTYNPATKEKIGRPITGLEKVTDFAYSQDGKKLAIAGVKKGKGQSDIFIYTINAGGLEQVTNDIWDDEHPRFIGNGDHLLFASNRSNDTIHEKHSARYEYEQSKYNDIFMYDCKKKSKILVRVTETPEINETQPADYLNGSFTYLSESNGIRNRFVSHLDSMIAYVDTVEHYRYSFSPKPLTNYRRNLLEHDINIKAKKCAEVFYQNGKQYMYINPLPKPGETSLNLNSTFYRRYQLTAYNKNKETPGNSTYSSPLPIKDTNRINVDNYPIGPEKNKGNETIVNSSESNQLNETAENSKDTAHLHSNEKKEFVLPILRNYYTNFAVDNVVTQLDNSYLNQTYQRFTGYYINPGVNAFFKVAMSDLFEDYRVVGGFRIAGNMNNEYYVSIENRKKLWDKQLILHRQTFLNVSDNDFLQKIHVHDGQFRLKYPFNEVSSIKGSFYYRTDRYVYVSTDDESLPKPNTYTNWAGLKADYVYDNTRIRGINIYNGIRLKVFAEYLRKVDKQRHDLIVYGFDVRHYQRIHRDLIWANRIAGSGSLGTDRLIYYLGGVDNWFAPKYDYNINILHPEQYQFQALATNMRGFKQNARNGNNFVAINSEIRWPIFRYLTNKPIRSDFINNFQIIGFGDVGSAWYGASPFSKENTENRILVPGNPINVVLIEQKEPIIGGYGFGFRSRLFGYFVRLDFAWGYDNKIKKERITYLSFTTDF